MLLVVLLLVLLVVLLLVESSGVAILGSGLVFLLDWGYDTHQTKIIEIHVSKATYMNKDYLHICLARGFLCCIDFTNNVANITRLAKMFSIRILHFVCLSFS